jgi:hypothetical protein
MVFKLKGTHAEAKYRGCGKCVLVVKDGAPLTLIYDGEESTFFNLDTTGTEIYYGMASCYEFVVERKMKLWKSGGHTKI